MGRRIVLLFALCAANATAQLVILGDSVAHGAGDETGRGIAANLAESLHERAVNLAVDGARTWNTLSGLRQLNVRDAIGSSTAVVLSIGGNDLFGSGRERLSSMLFPGISMHLVLSRVGSIVAELHSLNARTRVYVLGLYNPYRSSPIASWIDRQVAMWDAGLLRSFAADPCVDVIRIADLLTVAGRISPLDHFHPSAAGYAAIAQRIAATR